MERKANSFDRALAVMLALAVAVGALLCAGMWQRWAALRREAADVLASSEQTAAEWKAISDVKEAMQAELKEIQSAIREAELTCEESTAKAEEIRGQLPALQAEKEALAQWEASGAREADPALLSSDVAGDLQTLTVATEALRLNVSRQSAAGAETGAAAVRTASQRVEDRERTLLPLLIAHDRAASPLKDADAEAERQARLARWEERLAALTGEK